MAGGIFRDYVIKAPQLPGVQQVEVLSCFVRQETVLDVCPALNTDKSDNWLDPCVTPRVGWRGG